MVTAVTSQAATTSASDAMKQTIGMNKDDFLKLFITQLQTRIRSIPWTEPSI